MTRAATGLGLALGLAAGVATVAQAQPLVSNPGLTSLLQPQLLDRSRPLVSPDRAAGTRSGLPQGGTLGATPCDRGSTASPAGIPATPSLYGSGSGPGSFGRYMPGAPPNTEPGAKSTASPPPPSAATRTATADRPLYGGTDRPLWDTGERRAAAAAKTAPADDARTGPAGKDPAAAAPVQPNALPAPVRDRPLWMDGGLSGSPNPAPDAASDPSGGIAAIPCTASPGPAAAPSGR